MDRDIILASKSPRRRELLRQIGIPCTVVPAHLDEHIRQGETPESYASRLALEKAREVGRLAGNGLIIAADTIVVLNDTILGKPSGPEEAEEMLARLSGTMHRVITGLAVVDAPTGRWAVRTAMTRVWFRDLSLEDIRAYVSSGEPLDKAGAYGIQERGALFVETIEGCYFNVVGLPLALLAEVLKEFNINILREICCNN